MFSIPLVYDEKKQRVFFLQDEDRLMEAPVIGRQYIDYDMASEVPGHLSVEETEAMAAIFGVLKKLSAEEVVPLKS